MPEPEKPSVSRLNNNPASRIPPSRTPMPPRVDPSSKAYKQAASKYMRLMIAMPILLVTSYFLFDRLALGHDAKSLPATPVVDGANKDRSPQHGQIYTKQSSRHQISLKVLGVARGSNVGVMAFNLDHYEGDMS
ncbi:hypothetical protein HD806DRAFT_539396 [Xylariaceae sp. AK1471]|nr:hypothetical protein HD806DRAFT_539396 [Xylariaceae sp. AK1471]